MSDAYTAAWLAEMWPTVREVPREERDAERALARIFPTVPQPMENAGEKREEIAS